MNTQLVLKIATALEALKTSINSFGASHGPSHETERLLKTALASTYAALVAEVSPPEAPHPYDAGPLMRDLEERAKYEASCEYAATAPLPDTAPATGYAEVRGFGMGEQKIVSDSQGVRVVPDHLAAASADDLIQELYTRLR